MFWMSGLVLMATAPASAAANDGADDGANDGDSVNVAGGEASSRFSTDNWQVPSWDFIVLPVFGLNVDEGVGGGVLLAVHRYDDDSEAFRDDFALRFFVTTRLVQRHELKWEGLEVFDLPLRLYTRLGLLTTVTQNYCGTGNAVSCDPDRAVDAAVDAGLNEGSAGYDDFVRRYYLTRFIRPHGELLAWWRLNDAPYTIEVMGGARVAWFIPGDFLEDGPYPGSLYAVSFPNGEPGVSSVLSLGATIDHRDVEASPTRGFFGEASLRGATPLWGSTWTFVGVNIAGSLYTPMPLDMVLATRTIVDVILGDAPTEELAQIGGTRDHTAFGGQWIGRGLREHRGIGAIKVIEQLELRREIVDFVVFGARVDVGAGVFGDAGWIGAAADDFGGGARVDGGAVRDVGSTTRILFGVGAGLRIVLNRALLMRLDVAWSPFEDRTPAFYTPFGHPL
jgi:hypothetical protein